MTDSDKKYFKETLGCNEEQMQALLILFDYPIMSNSTIKDRKKLSKHIGKDDFYDVFEKQKVKYMKPKSRRKEKTNELL